MEKEGTSRVIDPQLPSPDLMKDFFDILKVEISLPGIPKPAEDSFIKKIPKDELEILGELPDGLKRFHYRVTAFSQRLAKVREEIKSPSGSWSADGFISLGHLETMAMSLATVFFKLVRIHFQYYGGDTLAILPDWQVVVVPGVKAMFNEVLLLTANIEVVE